MIEHVWTSSSVIILSSDLFHQINGTNGTSHVCGLSHHCFPNIAQHVGIDCTQSILSLLTLLTLPQRHCKISHIFSQSSLLIWRPCLLTLLSSVTAISITYELLNLPVSYIALGHKNRIWHQTEMRRPWTATQYRSGSR